MTLRVDPEAIRNYGFMLGRAHDDAQDCKGYFTAQVPEIAMGIEGGLISLIKDMGDAAIMGMIATSAIEPGIGAARHKLADAEPETALVDA
jgi:hypothetical protein